MDNTALFNLSYGMYAVCAKDGARNVGCVANSAIQITSEPPSLALSLNKNNYTNQCIKESNAFVLAVLTENIDKNLIATFGFSTSKDKDKFEGINQKTTESGIVIPTDGVCAYIDCRVIDFTDYFTHTIFVAEVINAENLSKETPMTYAYYHKVIKGKAPANAPTYVAEKTEKKYTCEICGYVYDAEDFKEQPDSYVCPICSAPKELFSMK